VEEHGVGWIGSVYRDAHAAYAVLIDGNERLMRDLHLAWAIEQQSHALC
jgi:hypothetical protein